MNSATSGLVSLVLVDDGRAEYPLERLTVAVRQLAVGDAGEVLALPARGEGRAVSRESAKCGRALAHRCCSCAGSVLDVAVAIIGVPSG